MTRRLPGIKRHKSTLTQKSFSFPNDTILLDSIVTLSGLRLAPFSTMTTYSKSRTTTDSSSFKMRKNRGFSLFVVAALVVGNGSAFVPSWTRMGMSTIPPTTRFFSSNNNNDPTLDRMKEIIKEESSDAQMMKLAAEQMRNLKPDDIDKMIKDMETMNPIQKQALKAMGADPDTMMSTMKMMRDNPQMMASAQKLMESMTPEQLMQQSKQAQERLKTMTPEQIQQANQAMGSIPQQDLDQAVELLKQQGKTIDISNNDDEEEYDDDTPATKEPIATGPGTSSDPSVISAMYKVAEFMSNDGVAFAQGIGGVTLAGFASLPVIQMLSGTREVDLSPAELKECWANGSLGATRVDRAGFERVWKEVQDYFEDDIMGEARKEAKNRIASKKRRGSDTKSTTTTTTTTSTSTTTTPKVGEKLSEEQLEFANQAFKNMSDQDMAAMFEAMQNPDPATEARLKAMGADPNMLKQTARLMNSNPFMRKAAKEMIANMSGKDMLKMSQQAQEEMKKMSPEQIQAMSSPEMQEALKGMTPEEIEQALKGSGKK